MNCGILKELFRQCQTECGFDDNKFVELIIKEATSLTLDYKSEDYYQGWLDYRDIIKEHFGMKA